jgi:iron(III) transport system ATP-binding protein
MTFLQLRSVRKRYGSVVALDGVDLDVQPGTRTAIVGPSGSGKTTMLRIIAGFEAPDGGQVIVGDQVFADKGRCVPAHLRGIGVVAQDGALFPHLTIADNIGFGLARNEPGRDQRIADLMKMVGLDVAMLPRKPDQLSGGQQQRVALARALARKPRLMLLDEPFSALDTGLRASTRKAVADLLSAHGVTTILVTHDQAEALSFADQVAVMHEGHLLQVGAPRELYLQPRTPLIAEFLGDALILPATCGNGVAQSALGRVKIQDPGRAGPAQIMLRPEQVALSVVAQDDGGGLPLAEVMHVDFGGAVSLVTVRLLGSHKEPHTLVLRRAGLDAPPPGSLVQVMVLGEAHVFA